MGDGSDAVPAVRRERRRGDEGGTAIVEFAIVVPLLFTLVFGMVSGGLAYNRKLALTNGVREGSRYGATLAVAEAPTLTPACGDQIDCWLAQVATVAQQAAEGELDPSVSTRQLCVAYVHPAGTGPDDTTRKLLRTSAADSFSAGSCFADGRPDGERRVQVTAQRDGSLDLLVSSISLTLQSRSVTRFEAAPS